jgi:hypothetical protein
MFHLRFLLKHFLLFLLLLASAAAQQDTGTPDGKKNQPRLRLICVSALEQEHEVKIASRDDKGEWLELGKTGIRGSFVSDWLPAKSGELHLTIPGADGPQSICKFNCPDGVRRALIVLIADPAGKKYRAVVYDPDKIEFAKGSVLVANFSSRAGMVVFGSRKVTVEPGGRSVVKPVPEKNGMYRMLVAYEDENRKPVACYDRYVQGNPDSRDLLFLIPDTALGIKAFSLPIFGSFD